MYNKVESNFFLTIREPYIHNVKTHPMKIEDLAKERTRRVLEMIS